MKIPLAQTNFHNLEDKLIWVHHKFEIFLIKSAYVVITMNQNHNMPPN